MKAPVTDLEETNYNDVIQLSPLTQLAKACVSIEDDKLQQAGSTLAFEIIVLQTIRD